MDNFYLQRRSTNENDMAHGPIMLESNVRTWWLNSAWAAGGQSLKPPARRCRTWLYTAYASGRGNVADAIVHPPGTCELWSSRFAAMTSILAMVLHPRLSVSDDGFIAARGSSCVQLTRREPHNVPRHRPSLRAHARRIMEAASLDHWRRMTPTRELRVAYAETPDGSALCLAIGRLALIADQPCCAMRAVFGRHADMGIISLMVILY
jgi:hypothetical protein